MEYEELTLDKIRTAARHFVPETRGDNGIAKRGSKEELIALLREKGVMASECAEYCAGNDKIKAPEDADVLPLDGNRGEVKQEEASGNAAGDNGGITGNQPPEVQEPAGAETKGGQKEMEQQEDKQPDELEILREIITRKVKQSSSVDEAAVGKIVDAKLDKFRKSMVKTLVLKDGKEPPRQIGICHKLTGQIAQVCKFGIHQMLVGAAGGGKTMIIVRNIVLRASKSAYSRHCILRRHYTDVRKSVMMDTFPKLMRIGFPGLDYKENSQTSVIRFQNGSEIWFGGLDKTDKILGNEYASMFFNEISEIGFEQLEVAQSRLAQKCADLDNKFFYDCNPPSKSHWAYKMFAMKQNPNDNTPLSNPALYGWMKLNPEGNRENLATGYITDVLGGLSGRNRKRFLEGEWLDDNENALWKRESMINPYRVGSVPSELDRIVVGVDPAVTQKDVSDHTGIVIAGCKRLRGEVHYFVLDDRSLIGSPHDWASTAINAYHEFKADRIVAETNQGGDMVEQTIRNIDRRIAYRSVRASRGKIVRAEPIAELYERGLVHHVGEFPAMEDEMCDYCGFENEKSPDRMDALVWALTELSSRGAGSSAVLA